jgi:hypothetical protein
VSPQTNELSLTEEPRVEASVSDRPSTARPAIPVMYTPSTSRSNSLRIDTPSTLGALDDLGLDIRGLDEDEPSGARSPLPVDERSAMMRDERRYRMLVEHSFHPSR